MSLVTALAGVPPSWDDALTQTVGLKDGFCC